MLRIIDCLATIILAGLPQARSFKSPVDGALDGHEEFDDDVYGNGTNCTNDYCITNEEYINLIAAHVAPDGYDWLLIAMHFVVFTVGLVGNSLVCIAVYRNHTMRTVTNYFIVNLALADLLVIIFCLPSSVLWDVTETWFLGLRLCKAIPYLQTVSVSVSVMTLTFISIDRWYAICFPLRFKSTTSRAKKAIFIIWFVSLVFDIPELVVLHLEPPKLQVETIFFTQCAPSWGPGSKKTFTFIKFIILYFGPLIFMSVAYYEIVRVLWRSDIPGHNLSTRVCQVNEIPSHSGIGNPEGQLRSRRKAAKMLVAVVVMFAICYLPVHLLEVLRHTVKLPANQLTTAFSLLAHWFCYANSAVNPLIYNFMSGKFRKEFKRTFCCSGNGSNNLGGGYKLTGVSTGRRSLLQTRSINTSHNNAQQSIELIPLSAIQRVQCIDKRN